MSRDGLRVMVLAIVSIVMIVSSALAMSWFVARIDGMLDVNKITFDLREARACSDLGPCGAVPMSKIRGFYPTSATVTLVTSLLFAALVLYQCGARVLGGFANETITRAGYGLSSLALVATVGAGYLFGPEIGSNVMMGLGIAIERTWAPLVMLAGVIAGNFALYFTKAPDFEDVPYKPIDPLVIATARAKQPTAPPPAERTKPPTAPPPVASENVAVARTKPATTPPAKKAPFPVPAVPEQCKGKIQFAVVAGDVTKAGIDARREDGHTVLVLWRDVVGLVARRLPPELEGHAFVDIVSTAGMTLRVLPWSKLTGESIEGDTGEARARAFVKHVAPRCPEAKLDRATQAFAESERPPAQLPSAEMLAKHDQALA